MNDIIDLPYRRRSAVRRPLDLVGVPYRRGGTTPESGFDCYTLAAYVRWHWFSRATPVGELPAPTVNCVQACAQTIRRILGSVPESATWERLRTPAPGCMVAMGRSQLSGLHHCGVWIGRSGVLHALDRIGVAFTPGERLTYLFGRVEFYECRR